MVQGYNRRELLEQKGKSVHQLCTSTVSFEGGDHKKGWRTAKEIFYRGGKGVCKVLTSLENSSGCQRPREIGNCRKQRDSERGGRGVRSHYLKGCFQLPR